MGVCRHNYIVVFMTHQESTRFNDALRNERFSDYHIKIVNAIFAGEGNLNQENILCTSDEGIRLLRKLGWYKKVKLAIKKSGLHLLDNNQIIIKP